MAKFKVGEIAWLLPNIYLPLCEVTVLGGPWRFCVGRRSDGRSDWSAFWDPLYIVVDEAGSRWGVTEDLLRKIRPPREDLQISVWTECPWSPELSRLDI
jgi:hypothetical protein